MLSAPPRVRAQLSEALSIISQHDFPARWPSLLPHLVDKLGSADPAVVNGVLSTADSIYQRYRCVCALAGRACPARRPAAPSSWSSRELAGRALLGRGSLRGRTAAACACSAPGTAA